MHGEGYLRSGFSYLFIGDYQQAQIAFEKAIAENPENAVYAFHGSMTAWRNGELEKAQKWAKQAVQLEPENHLYQEHLKLVMDEGNGTSDFEEGVKDI